MLRKTYPHGSVGDLVLEHWTEAVDFPAELVLFGRSADWAAGDNGPVSHACGRPRSPERQCWDGHWNGAEMILLYGSCVSAGVLRKCEVFIIDCIRGVPWN